MLARFLPAPVGAGVAGEPDLIYSFQPDAKRLSLSADAREAKTAFASLPCKPGSRLNLVAID